ncbi:28909_t:CDS:10, partial [Gigaspora margarita]
CLYSEDYCDMGKPKNQPRIKGNVQPASSSRAAEIIATGGTQVPTENLGGFAQFLGGTPFSTPKSLSPDTQTDKANDVDLDPTLVLIFKRLSKRDTTTKLKALEELEAYLRGKEDNEIDPVNLTSVWAKFFVKLAIEVDRRIRYTTYSCHLLIVSKVKKRLASNLKEIIGVWIISLFDQYKDVARIATESFQTAFPAGKRVEVLIFCQMEILSYISDIIIHKTPETLSDPRFTSKEDMISKYERVVASSYYSLAHLIDSLLKAAQQYDDLFDNPKTWKNLTNSNPLVRKSCYNMIKVLTNKWPRKVEDRLDVLSTTYLMNIFNDKDITVYGDLWDSLLLFTKNFPNTWLLASKKKPMLNKLYNFLRSACYGTTLISYTSILALVNLLPQELIITDPKFYDEFFLNFWKGLSNTTIDRSNSGVFLQAYIECLLYFISKLDKSENEKQTRAYLLEFKFFELFKLYLTDFKSCEKFQVQQMCSILAHNMNQLTIKLQKTDASDILQHKLQSLIVNVINDVTILNPDPKLEDNFKEFCQRLADFFIAISSTAKTENKQEISNAIMDMISVLVEDVFCISLSKCKEINGRSVGLCLLLSNLSKNFISIFLTRTASKQALKSFLSNTIFDIVKTAPITCLNYALDLFVSCLTCSAELPEAQYNWNKLVQSFLEIETFESKLDGLYLLISKVLDVNTSASFLVGQLNEYLIILSNQLLYQQVESTTRTKIENLLCIVFLFKGSLLTSETKLKVLNNLTKAIISCANWYYIAEDSVVSNEVALSVLRIFAKLFKDEEFIEFFLYSDMLPVSGQIFELTFISPHEGFNTEVIKDIQQFAQDCWDRIALASRSHLREVAIINVSQQIKSSLLNIHYSASPTDFALRVKKLCSFCEDDLKLQEIIESFHIEDEIWRELSKPFLSPIDPSLSIVDPMVLPLNSDQQNNLQNNLQTTAIVAYDSYGLSVYGRLGLFLIELIHKIGIDYFFIGNHEKLLKMDTKDNIPYSNCNRIILELLLIYVLCTDIRRSCKSDHHLWDAFNVEESDYRGFKAFLEDVHLIVKNYTLQMFQNEQLDIKSILNSLNTTMNSHNIPHTATSSLLCEAVKRSHGDNSGYWARVLHILCSEIFNAASVSFNQAEGFLDVIKSESMNLVTRMAFVLSLKTFLGASTKYKDFQNDMAVKLISLDPMEIFSEKSLESNNGLTCLCLLITSTSKDDELFLSPDTSIKLLMRIQEWRNTIDLNIWSKPVFAQIHILIAKLLYSLVITIQELYGSHWNFIFELLQYWLQETSQLELLYEAICIFCRLNSIAYSSNKIDVHIDDSAEDTGNNLSSKFITYKPLLYQQLSLLLFREKAHRDNVLSYQYCKYLEILCEACYDLPKETLFNKKDELYALLLIPHEGIQKCAYKLSHVLVSEKVLRLSEELEFLGTSDESISVQLDQGLKTLLIEMQQSDHLNLIHTSNPNSIIVHKTFGYLLAWMLIFDHFNNATLKFKSQLILCIKEIDITSKFCYKIFETLGLGGQTTPYNLSKWDIREFYIEAFELQYSAALGFPLLCAHLYYRSLRHIPSIVRTWWSECKKRQLSIGVDSYTEKYFSPIIIQGQLDMLQSEDVKSQLEDEKFTIRIARSSNEVIAAFNVDEYVMELSIRMPNNFPLRQAEFGTLERMGTTEVTDLKWAKLPVQTVVNSQVLGFPIIYVALS